jgi:hypothetical protein
MLKMKIALDELLKTKGGESALDGLMKINKLVDFAYDFIICKELVVIFAWDGQGGCTFLIFRSLV